MERVQKLRQQNGNFRLAWLIMEHTLEKEDVELLTTQELKSVCNDIASTHWKQIIHDELERRNHG